MMKLLILFCLVALAKSQTTADQNAMNVATGLYTTLRNIAFPNHQLTDTKKHVESRFLMLVPGKVLNYYDYHPGTEYTNFIQVRCHG